MKCNVIVMNCLFWLFDVHIFVVMAILLLFPSWRSTFPFIYTNLSWTWFCSVVFIFSWCWVVLYFNLRHRVVLILIWGLRSLNLFIVVTQLAKTKKQKNKIYHLPIKKRKKGKNFITLFAHHHKKYGSLNKVNQI